MLCTTLLAAVAFAPQGGGAPVVINEFSYDDSGTDDREYVELYNRSNAAVDISGWILDSQDENGPNTAYTVDPNTILQPGDYWVMGSALVPNVDQVVGTTDIWENSMESLELKDPVGALIDSLVYEANKASFPSGGIAEGEGIWGNFTSIDGLETSWSRQRDGYDTDDNGDDFRMQPWSPGTSNDLPPNAGGAFDYDAATVGASLGEWGASFATAKAIDPTVADGINPNAIPASPQGGNAAVFWDNSGGGNTNMFLADATDAMHLEAHVYFDATPRPTGEYESWAFGVGTTGTFYNTPDLGGVTAGFTANGNTGIVWNYFGDETGGTLFLIDYNNGGVGTAALTQPVVLGQIAITAGVNDGWQRLSLTVDGGGSASGRFGGTFGAADGTLISGTASTGPRGIYVGYREFLTDNTTARPFTCDGLLVGAPVVINEFAYDDSSTDDREYVELYNRSGSPIDVGDWVLDSEDPSGPNAAFAIPTGTTLQPGQFWVMGSALVPNVDQIVGTTDIWENSEESLTLRDPAGAMVDTLIYEANKSVWDPTLAEGEGVWGNFTSIDGLETSWSRQRDGYDTDNNGDDFRMQPWSPGASNDLPVIARADADFDALTVGADVPDWGASFSTAKVIDPTLADGVNPNAIAASPQGGNAAIFWDNSGGGNSNMFVADGSDSSHLEAYVYFDATPRQTGEYENWTFGVGTTGTFYNSPDLGGPTAGFTANGNTGVAWSFLVDETGATLSLFDYNDGGWPTAALTPPVLLGQVTVTAGVNDGWQRLSLTVSNGTADGRFGGTYGAPDGTLISGGTSTGRRGVYVGYREFVTDNTTTRPFTCDGLQIVQCNAAASRLFGSAVAGSAGTLPTITASGDPRLGASITVDAAGLIPNDTAWWLVGFERTTPIDLPGLTPSGFGIWVDAFDCPGLPTDGAGASTFPLTVPSSVAFCGFELALQAFQIDTQLTAAVPVFHTQGIVLHTGN